MAGGITDREDWREFKPIPRPKGMRKRADKACYRNAVQIVIDKRYPGLTYAEGLAWNEHGPVHHAWVVDEGGHAIDPTWREPGVRYAGIALSPAEMDSARLGGPQIVGTDEVAMFTAVLGDA